MESAIGSNQIPSDVLRGESQRGATAGPYRNEFGRSEATEARGNVDSVALSQLLELGFDKESAKLALVEANGDLVLAVDILTRS
jgi:hypothetical protein